MKISKQLARRMRDDPFVFGRVLWPDVIFYGKQVKIIESVEWEADETVVPAGNKLGKDFVAGFIALSSFIRKGEARIITTSVADDHLTVLWAEMARFIQSSEIPLLREDGGPLKVKFREITKWQDSLASLCSRTLSPKGEDTYSYLKGMVALMGEKLSGHHADYTLGIIDEACHDDKTEVCTEFGWKKFADLKGDERLLTLDPHTRKATYQLPTNIIKKQYKGEMYLYERRGANFCVTPNHNMLWKRRMYCTKYTPYYLERMDSVVSNNNDRHIPRCFVWEGGEPSHYIIPHYVSERKEFPSIEVLMEEWLEFIGWFFSEGSFQFRDSRAIRSHTSCLTKVAAPASVVITQKDPTILRRLADIVSRWGFKPRIYNSNDEAYQLVITDLRLANHLSTFGRYCSKKKLPSFIGTLSPRLIEIFLQAYKMGDGYDKGSGKEIIYTSSKAIADELQILSFKAGRESTVTFRKLVGLPAPHGIARHDGFVVGRSKKDYDSHIKVKREYLQKVQYDGMVYCATVPEHHTLFTRRKGVCLWSGNSGVEDDVKAKMDGWAKKFLIIGNCWTPQGKFFIDASEGGNVLIGSSLEQEDNLIEEW